MDYIIWKWNGTTLTRITDVYPVKGTNDVYGECIYTAWGSDAVLINLLPQKFFDANGVNPISNYKMYEMTDQDLIESLVPESDIEANYGLWYFNMKEGLTSILKSQDQSQYKLSFERMALQDDINHIGEYATASTLDTTINLELLTAYPNADIDEYVNVYKTNATTNVYESYLFDDVEWVSEGSILNGSIIDKTVSVNETFKSTVFSNEDYTTEYDPSELAEVLNRIYTELADLQDKYDALLLLLE